MVAIRAGVPCVPPLDLGRWIDALGGRADPGARAHRVERIAPIGVARAGDLAPVTHRRYLGAAALSEAVLLVDEALADRLPVGRRWSHPHPAYVLARLLEHVRLPAPPARIDPGASIGAGAVILDGAVVGDGVRIEPNAVVYGGVEIRAGAHIGAGCVIGREGFGFAEGPGGALVRVPQLGGVSIEEDVELGPLCTVDAGTLTPTIVERGAKLDAQVHVGHNTVVGAGTMVAAQAGFAGSVHIGKGCRVGGQAGVADHVRVGDGAMLAAKSGVIGDVPAGAVVAGYPAVARARWLRAVAASLQAPRGRPSGSGKDEEP